MNMKNTLILLIFLLSVVGLIIGVYYTELDNVEKTPHHSWERLYEENNGVLTVTLEKKEKNESFMDKYLT